MNLARTGICSLAVATLALEATASDWLPDRCAQVVEARLRAQTDGVAVERASGTRAWNRHYQAGFAAIRKHDFELAEQELCLALDAARSFDGDDWRFGETLDELGLVYHMTGETRASERMQGAAVTEILLAVGPPDPKDELDPVCTEPSVLLYLDRLAIVYEAQGRDELIEELERAPYRILGLGYLPFDSSLERRAEALISEYLRLEDLVAVEYLTALLDGRSDR